MSDLRVGDIVKLKFGGIGQITKRYGNGHFFVNGFECCSESHYPEDLELYIPKQLEERISKLEEAIKGLI